MGHGGRLPARPTGAQWEEARPAPLLPHCLLSCAPQPLPLLARKKSKQKIKQLVKSKLFHKLVSDRRLSCCAVESSMSDIRARRARQLHQIASLVGLTEKFRPAAR